MAPSIWLLSNVQCSLAPSLIAVRVVDITELCDEQHASQGDHEHLPHTTALKSLSERGPLFELASWKDLPSHGVVGYVKLPDPDSGRCGFAHELRFVITSRRHHGQR